MDAVFRKFPDGEVIALLCDTAPDCNPGNVMSYVHVGQHGEASRGLGRSLRLATPAEYEPLRLELEAVYGQPVRAIRRLRANPRAAFKE
jgi:hypothetical protein